MACLRTVVALLAILPALGVAQAQQLVDLKEAYRLAEEHDPQIAAARELRRAQQEQVPQARSLLLPQISASATANRVWEDISVDAPPAPEDPGAEPAPTMGPADGDAAYTTANVGLNLTQALFRWEAVLALRQSRLVEDQADVEFLLAEQQLGLRVADAYFGMLEAQDALRTFEAELRAVDTELERAQRRYELGVGAITEVHDAQARHAATRADVLRSRSQLRLARETLRRTVSASIDEVVPLPADFRPQAPLPDDPLAWVELAQARGLPVRGAELALEVARATVDAARAERYPALDLVATLQHDYQGENPLAGGMRMETDRASVGIQLTLPLYLGGGIGAGVRQSVAEREAGFQQLRDARRTAALDAEAAFIGLESSLEQVSALAEALEAAQLAERSTERGLELGQRTTLDLLNVQRERFQVERNLAAARYEYLLYYLQLRIAVGDPPREALEAINALLR